MDKILWSIQALLAAVFLLAAVVKIRTSKERFIRAKVLTPGNSVLPIRAIGALEILGVFGIVLPLLINTMPVLTPVTALCFCMLMVGAAVVHLKRKEYIMLPLLTLVFLLSATVLFYRTCDYILQL